ncbi:MAG: helix-turn-helix domain-containing protein [Clostridia bacterium]|nr:helix-turn-helix domain-containing protein [Clostridia bacterium]
MNRLTRQEAAEFLGCSMTAFYGLEKSGQLDGTYYKIGRRRFYIKEKLEDWAMSGGEKDWEKEYVLRNCKNFNGSLSSGSLLEGVMSDVL